MYTALIAVERLLRIAPEKAWMLYAHPSAMRFGLVAMDQEPRAA